MLLGLTLAGGYGAITPIKHCNAWSVTGPEWTGETQLFRTLPHATATATATGSKVSAISSAWAWDRKWWWWERNNQSAIDNINKAHCKCTLLTCLEPKSDYCKSDYWFAIIGWIAGGSATEYKKNKICLNKTTNFAFFFFFFRFFHWVYLYFTW